MTDWLIVRPAVPADADALVELGLDVAGEPELSARPTTGPAATSGATCAASSGYPNVAVFVADTAGRHRRPPLDRA